MKKYIKLLNLGIKKVFVYRFSIVLILLSSFASIFILQKFWLALYGSEPSKYFYMANYAIISQLLGILYRFRAPGNLANRIRSGAISIELLRPWEYINAMLFEDLGTIIGNLLSSGVVLFVTAKLVFDLYIPSMGSILMFFLSALLGFLILFLVKTLVALSCFWLVEASALLVLINVVVNLLSGQFLPSWMAPEWFEKIMNALPFIWIYQKPISIYMEAANAGGAGEVYPILFMQLVWVVGLYIVILKVWRIAVGKLSVQGG